VHIEEPEERERPGWFAKTRVFLEEAWQELKMVTFPTWREVRARSAIVLLFIILLASYIYLVDQICNQLLNPLLFRR
jgi:preprotein translocase SecE subunit